jgi:DNA-directed RNA polymerase beta' subunit
MEKENNEFKVVEFSLGVKEIVLVTENENLAKVFLLINDYTKTECEDTFNEIIEKELYNHRIKQILSRITDETVIKAGKPLASHPKNLILSTIRVPPNTIRPDIRKLGGNRSNNSDITSFTKNIVELNNDNNIINYEITN